MSARVHVHLHATDLAKSREFYEKFFDTLPVKEKSDHLKFLPEFAPINLALSPSHLGGSESRSVSHLGVEVDSAQLVEQHLARVKSAGLKVREELNVNCCYANQTKFWVEDPDGVEWEVYHLNYDIDEKHGPAREAPASTRSLPIVQDEACCAGRALSGAPER